MPADRYSRMLSGDEAFALVERSPLAIRVFLAMFWGGGSERCGVARAKPGEIADDLKSSRRAIVAALQELQAAELIIYSESEQLAYRPRFALHFRPTVRNNFVAWQNSALAIRDGLIRAQVLDDLMSGIEPSSTPSSLPSSGPSSTPKTLETLETLESLETSKTKDIAAASQPDPVSDRIDDDSKPQQDRLAGEQSTGELHRRLADAVLAAWIDNLVPLGNPSVKPDRQWYARNGRNLAKCVAAVGGMDNLSMLMVFAANELPYHSGREYDKTGKVRAWTLTEWCARANVEKVQAALNSWVVRETGHPSVCQLDWSVKPTFALLEA